MYFPKIWINDGERGGFLCDNIKFRNNKYVKNLLKKVKCSCNIMTGGTTPVFHPFEWLLNKIFKENCRDICEKFMITATIYDKSSHHNPPSENSEHSGKCLVGERYLMYLWRRRRLDKDTNPCNQIWQRTWCSGVWMILCRLLINWMENNL